MSRKGDGVTLQQIIQMLSDFWVFVLAFVGHLIRTEMRDAVLKTRLDNLEKQRHTDMTRIEAMWAEVRGDIKLLLQNHRRD